MQRVVTDDSVKKHELPGQTSLSLLLRLQAHDQEAWRRLVSLYTPLVYCWCRQAELQGADAADVGQEVFRAVACKIAGFRRDQPGQSFRAWLRTITRSKIHDLFRARRNQPTGPGGSDAQRFFEGVAEAESGSDAGTGDRDERKWLYRRAVELVRETIEEHTWQAFWMVVVEGQTPRDVAAKLGIQVNSVYLAKSRVRSRVREEFEDLLDSEPGE